MVRGRIADMDWTDIDAMFRRAAETEASLFAFAFPKANRLREHRRQRAQRNRDLRQQRPT